MKGAAQRKPEEAHQAVVHARKSESQCQSKIDWREIPLPDLPSYRKHHGERTHD